ncbi:ABC transporter permease [Dyadobacter sandarakinus]|uniref:DUF3526 domain-containing protein n=1 Tax=Dyadobacter sandarakinus TaxID=2747268 RepID=A0ABX7I5T0_9BACT|nr:DUF3526 domain-containing protein [Dyadobacter sandarakinus]QRR00852.1 DUF3526 domain-containing protein [Dyadobacter sandarakinus]
MMITSRKVLMLEAKNFVLGRTVLTGTAFLLIFAAYGFFYGNHLIGQHQKTIHKIPQVQKEHLQEIVEHGSKATVGTTAYYPFFYTSNPPAPWARFAIGQRDVNPYTLKVKMLAIEGQLYDSELNNPLTLLVGNLDTSFIFIFLFPLLIIALLYNVISDEVESGVWKFVRTTTGSIGQTIAGKLLIRYTVVILITLAIFALSVIALQLPLTGPTFQLMLILLPYVLFWLLVGTLVVGMGKSSAFNATTLVCVWIFLAILFPGIANIAVNIAVPVPEAAETALRQREGYHKKWDLPKGPTMEKFYAVYPQYRKYPIAKDKYSPGWYYAMQFSGDLESAHSAVKLFEKLHQRQLFSETIGVFNPVITAQQALNKIANTDLASQVRYLESVRTHHRQIREYFYPFIFENVPTSNIDWAGYPAYKPVGYVAEPLASSVASIAVWNILLAACALFLFKINFIQSKDLQNA